MGAGCEEPKSPPAAADVVVVPKPVKYIKTQLFFISIKKYLNMGGINIWRLLKINILVLYNFRDFFIKGSV